MSDRTGIEWTDATWNPVTGCTKVSPGCDHCYAETFAERFRGTEGHYFERGFDVQLRPEKLDQPLRWRRPRRIFVNSMSDLFHDQVPDEYIAQVWAVMALAPQHTFQVLTKRHGRMRSLLSSARFDDLFTDALYSFESPTGDEPAEPVGSAPGPLPNVWLGVSVEDQKRADLRVPALLDTPAAVRFLSCEPLLGPVDLTGFGTQQSYWLTGRPGWGAPEPGPLAMQPLEIGPRIDWVIVGGESGPHARPMHPTWARLLRNQCVDAGVPFHFKQWGEWGPIIPASGQPRALIGFDDGLTQHLEPDEHIRYFHRAPGSVEMFRVGKKAAGRELEGRTWDQFPEAVTAP